MGKRGRGLTGTAQFRRAHQKRADTGKRKGARKPVLLASLGEKEKEYAKKTGGGRGALKHQGDEIFIKLHEVYSKGSSSGGFGLVLRLSNFRKERKKESASEGKPKRIVGCKNKTTLLVPSNRTVILEKGKRAAIKEKKSAIQEWENPGKSPPRNP